GTVDAERRVVIIEFEIGDDALGERHAPVRYPVGIGDDQPMHAGRQDELALAYFTHYLGDRREYIYQPGGRQVEERGQTCVLLIDKMRNDAQPIAAGRDRAAVIQPVNQQPRIAKWSGLLGAVDRGPGNDSTDRKVMVGTREQPGVLSRAASAQVQGKLDQQ